jgi:pimeloyl-ACP methyl ester carboxylesterase
MSGFPLSRRDTFLGAAAASLAAAPAQADIVAIPGLKRGYVDGPYGQIHYRIVQPAKSIKTPLMYLHASPLSGAVYETWLQEIGKDRLAVAPDTPGYGGSDTPPHPLQIGDFADCMIAFMDQMKLKVVDVFGYHTGSLTSVEIARKYPKRIRKVVMISAPNYTPEERAAAKARVGTPAPTFEQMLDSTLKGYRTQGQGLFRDMPPERYYDVQLDRMRHYRTSNWGFQAAYNYDVGAMLRQVKQPVLILNPEDDVWEKTPRVKNDIQNGHIHDFPGWTHGHLDVHTVEMAKVVREFLDG